MDLNDKLETLGNVPFIILFTPGESQKSAIIEHVTSSMLCRFITKSIESLKPLLLAHHMVEEMQHCFEGMLSTMMKDVNEKMGIMQARMDEKDGVIKNLKVRMDSKDGNIKDLKVTIKDMKARMDEKDDFTEGLQAEADVLHHDLQKERNV